MTSAQGRGSDARRAGPSLNGPRVTTPRLDKQAVARAFEHDCDRELGIRLWPRAVATREGIAPPAWRQPRPGLQLLIEAGNAWEQRRYRDLLWAFGPERVRSSLALPGDQDTERGAFRPTSLVEELRRARPRELVIEGEFSVPPGRWLALRRLVERYGLTLAAMRPDVVWLRRYPTGLPLLRDADPANRPEFELCVVDTKLAAEPSLRHLVEVTLYALGLDALLRDSGLAGRYAVAGTGFIWPGSYDESRFRATVAALRQRGESEPEARALEQQFQAVPLEVYGVHVGRLLAERLPRVLETQPRDLGWFVTSRCYTCENLSHCRAEAERQDHLSRLPGLTAGQAEILQAQGLRTVTALLEASRGTTPPGRRAWRAAREASPPLAVGGAVLAAQAEALVAGRPVVVPDRRTGLMPRWADLRLFTSVHRDPGSGLVFAIGVSAVYFPPAAAGATLGAAAGAAPGAAAAAPGAERGARDGGDHDADETGPQDGDRAGPQDDPQDGDRVGDASDQAGRNGRQVRAQQQATGDTTATTRGAGHRQPPHPGELGEAAVEPERRPERTGGPPSRRPATERHVFLVEQRDVDCERRCFLAYLRSVNRWLTRAAAEGASAHFYFWDGLHLQQLRQLLERHMGHPDVAAAIAPLLGMFPPAAVLPDVDQFRSQPGTLVHDVLRAVIGLPLPHTYTPLEAAAAFDPPRLRSGEPYRFAVPWGFAADLTGQIAFERAYELWEGRVFLRPLGEDGKPGPPLPRDELAARLRRAVGVHLGALEHLVRRLEARLGDRLTLRKEPLVLRPAVRAALPRVSQELLTVERLEAIAAELENRRDRALPVEEREARFLSMRGLRPVDRVDGAAGREAAARVVAAVRLEDPRYLERRLLVCTLAPTSRDARIKVGDFLLALWNGNVPGAPDVPEGPDLLDRPWRRLLDLSFEQALRITGSRWWAVCPLRKLLQVEVADLRAGDEPPLITLAPVSEPHFALAEDLGLVNLDRPLVLDPVFEDYRSRRIEATLRAVGGAPAPRPRPRAQAGGNLPLPGPLPGPTRRPVGRRPTGPAGSLA